MVESRESRIESQNRSEERGARSETRFAFRLPASAFPLRFAITLTEVLISMGILTVGLLGVAALFPVGGFYMQKAEIADRGSAIAQSVMNDIASRGILNPRSWYVAVPWTSLGTPASAVFPSDGKYAPSFPALRRATFSRPFAITLAEALNQPTAPTDPTLIGKQFGSAFVIDPIGAAAMAFTSPLRNSNLMTPPQPWVNGPATVFPGAAYGSYGLFYPATSAWGAWGTVWPVRRVTFRESDTGWQLEGPMAEHYFRAGDDLSTDQPPRDDWPAKQNWDTFAVGADSAPLARQWAGDYSWLVTVAPPTNAARDGLTRDPEGHVYDVSVVVFHKRVLPPSAASIYPNFPVQNDFANAMSENERAVQAKVISTGLNGGELLLERLNDGNAKSPFDYLKTGHWIMLCGPHPVSTESEPRFSLNWYQVLSIEGRDRKFDANGNETNNPAAPERRLVTVRGPQWAWVPGETSSTNLCVAICRGAVAVHTKTMRLEKNASMMFGSSGSITATPPPDGLY